MYVFKPFIFIFSELLVLILCPVFCLFLYLSINKLTNNEEMILFVCVIDGKFSTLLLCYTHVCAHTLTKKRQVFLVVKYGKLSFLDFRDFCVF